MIYLNETFGSFYGSGHLTVGDNWSPTVAYKLVLRRDDFSGGGLILGLTEEDAAKAAALQYVRLAIASDRLFEMVVGYHDSGPLSVAVTGLSRRPS